MTPEQRGQRMIVAVLAVTALLLGMTIITIDRAYDAQVPQTIEQQREAACITTDEGTTCTQPAPLDEMSERPSQFCRDQGGRPKHDARGVICVFVNGDKELMP